LQVSELADTHHTHVFNVPVFIALYCHVHYFRFFLSTCGFSYLCL